MVDKNYLQVLQAIFNEIDKDKSGYIDFSELEEFMVLLAKKLNHEPPQIRQITQTFLLLDKDGDEKITFPEMVPYLNKLLDIMKGIYK